MPRRIPDFRTVSPFSVTAIDRSGSFIGGKVYWKLYAIENIYRVIIHSILSIQIGHNWWNVAVAPKIQNDATRFKQDYTKRPWHSLPGTHDIYYIHLSQLNEVVRIHSHLFIPLIPDIDQWIVRVETLRLPRNIVAHMNFPGPADKSRIDVLYSDFQSLITSLFNAPKLTLQVPA
jgi:hypothetical protein